jgi:integrase
MGRQHVKDGVLTITQEKNGQRNPVTVSIPILSALQAVLDDVQSKRIAPTFVLTEYGKPFTKAGFGNWFADRCDEAGLVGLSAHGLRKAFCRVAAETGLSAHQIMSITGHKTLTEVTRYTAAADRTKLAKEGMAMIETGTGFGNPKR